MSRSTIMDGNSYRAAGREDLDEETRRLIERREGVLAGSYRLFYRRPVHLVRGIGAHLWDRDGRRYLDLYNNVVSLGHCHPAVIEAVSRQMGLLNTHTRYLHEGILDYSEQLLGTLPGRVDRVVYACTGSEANDLALRVAREHTGARGVVVTSEAYHGTSELTGGVSPALGSGQPLAPTTRTVPAPTPSRPGAGDAGRRFAASVRAAVEDLRSSGAGVAALLVDPMFSSDGVHPGEPGMLREAVDVVRSAGGVLIADEVQPGFGRTGESFWGFGRHGLDPELVTLGKPMGNGMPVAALAGDGRVMASFSDRVPYFNTFGGNPVSMAAAAAVLRTLREEDLQAHSARVGATLREALEEVARRHDAVGEVRGAGLFLGVELVADPGTGEPDAALALDVVEGMRERGVLTSVAGPHNNVLKVRPPLAFAAGDVDWAVTAFEEALVEARGRTS